MASFRDLAPIENGVTYPLPEFERRSGLGRHAMAQARRKGLQVCRLGGRVYVRGEDFSEFLASQQDAQDGR
jgi:hypothetical protein